MAVATTKKSERWVYLQISVSLYRTCIDLNINYTCHTNKIDFRSRRAISSRLISMCKVEVN